MQGKCALAAAVAGLCVFSVLFLSAERSEVLLESAAEEPTPHQQCGGAHAIPPLDAAHKDEYKLSHVSVVMRHGDRTRTSYPACWEHDDAKYDCDLCHVESLSGQKLMGDSRTKFETQIMEERGVLPGSCALGQLTPIGYNQQFMNGKIMRDSYAALLPDTYDNNEDAFSFRSDAQPRTKMSGQALVDGLFASSSKPSTKLQSLLGLGLSAGKPVPWNMIDAVKDNMFPNWHLCPALNRAVQKGKDSEEYKQFLEQIHDPMMAKLATILKKDAKEVKVMHVMDCLTTHKCHDQPVPHTLADPSLLDELVDINYKHFHIVAKHTRKFAAGLLLGEIMGKLHEVVKQTTPLKFALYSGHDTTLMALLQDLDIPDGHWPPYASTLAFEVYKKQSKAEVSGYVVRVVYNGQPKTLPGCPDALCPWEKLQELLATAVPSSAECQDAEFSKKMVHWANMMSLDQDPTSMGGGSMSSPSLPLFGLA